MSHDVTSFARQTQNKWTKNSGCEHSLPVLKGPTCDQENRSFQWSCVGGSYLTQEVQHERASRMTVAENSRNHTKNTTYNNNNNGKDNNNN